MTYTGTMVLPQNAVVMKENDMRYVEGGAKYVKYSYRKIKNAVIGTICVASIGLGIVGLLSTAGLVSVALGAIASSVSGILGGIAGLVSLVAKGSKSKGLKLHLKQVTRNRKGDLITQWEPYKVTKY